MKTLMLAIPLVSIVAACETPEERAVGTGALAGAALGAAVADDGDRAEGALIGGAAGAVVGGLIGQAQQPGDCVYQDRYGNRYVAACP
ncbi:MAG: hypothetical protein B7Z02_02530 [Rhodobacterales bacterium 32-67-9]|nr:MAG: hypothetical protein B7Z02_02530 [Rhodobacterales bacterium 32-67-9]